MGRLLLVGRLLLAPVGGEDWPPGRIVETANLGVKGRIGEREGRFRHVGVAFQP